MTTRTVTGTIFKPDGKVYTLIPAANIELRNDIFSGGVVYPKAIIPVFTDAAGAFSANLAVPDSGVAPYRIAFTDGFAVDFNLGAGASVDLSTLISIPVDSTLPTAINTHIYAHDPPLMKIYNVLTYGAKGDGITDDTDALQDTMDAAYAVGGGEVFLPGPATYPFSTRLELETGVSLIGDRIAVLQAIGDIAGIRLHDGSQVLRGFTLHGGNGDPTNYTALHFGISQAVGPVIDVTIEDVTVYHFGSNGISIAQPTRVTVRGCNVYDNGGEGIFFSHGPTCHDNLMIDNFVHGNGYNGVDSNADGTIIRGNEIYGNGVVLAAHPGGIDCSGICIAAIGGTGFDHGNTSNILVEDNHVYDNYAYGIFATTSESGTNYATLDGLTIANNQVHDNGDPAATYRDGICLAAISANSPITNAVIIGNIVDSGHYDSLTINGVGISKLIISGNIFTGAEAFPIQIKYATTVTIIGNHLEPSVHDNSIGLYMVNAASYCRIAENTIINCKAYCVDVSAGCLNNVVTDNYLYYNISGGHTLINNAGIGTTVQRNIEY